MFGPRTRRGNGACLRLLTRLPVQGSNGPPDPSPAARIAELCAFTPPPGRPSVRRP